MERWMVIVESSFSFPNSTLFALFLLFAVHIDAALHTNDTRRCWLIGQRLFRPRPPSTVHPRLSLPASRVPSSKHSATNQFSTLLPVMVQVDGQIIDGNGPMAPLATSHSQNLEVKKTTIRIMTGTLGIQQWRFADHTASVMLIKKSESGRVLGFGKQNEKAEKAEKIECPLGSLHVLHGPTLSPFFAKD